MIYIVLCDQSLGALAYSGEGLGEKCMFVYKSEGVLAIVLNL